MKDLEYYMNLPYRTEIVKDSEKDSFVAYCPELEGCITSGSTAIEAIEGIEDAKKKAAYADLLILDSVSKTVPGVGAAGVTHDWSIDRAIVEAVGIPVILAGGLGPENVAEAIEAVHPDGVDSLTKTSVVKGGVILHKDIDRVREFCRIAKSMQ